MSVTLNTYSAHKFASPGYVRVRLFAAAYANALAASVSALPICPSVLPITASQRIPAPITHCACGSSVPRSSSGEGFGSVSSCVHATALARSRLDRRVRIASRSACPEHPIGLYRLSVACEKTQLAYGGGASPCQQNTMSH